MKAKLMTIFIFSLLFVGCTVEKIATPIYKSDHTFIKDNIINFEEFKNQLEENGVEIKKIDPESELDSFSPQYYAEIDDIEIKVFTKERLGHAGEQVLQHVQIITKKEIEILTQPFFEGLIYVAKDDKLSSWIADLEGKYKDYTSSSDIKDRHKIRDIAFTGKIYIDTKMYTSMDETYKKMDLYWGSWENIPTELEGVAAELIRRGLIPISYTNGVNGKQINLESLAYRMYDSTQLYVYPNNTVSYKIMYDPNANYSYSIQLYSKMANYFVGEDVKIRDIMGIHTIAKVMDMSPEDFDAVTGRINQEMKEARNLTKPSDLRSKQSQEVYSWKGKIKGYYCEVYVKESGAGYGFTILLEKF